MKTLFIVLTLALAACTSQKVELKGKTVRIATDQDPTTFDPRVARDLITLDFLGLMFEGLMRHDAEGKLERAIAEDVEISSDGLTYTFHLKPTQWSNGDPVTAGDFAFAWNSIINKECPAPFVHIFSSVESIDSEDPSKLFVKLKSVNPLFLEICSTITASPLPQKHIQSHPDWATELDEFVCNGPYKPVSYARQDRAHFTKNSLFRLSDQLTYDDIWTYTVKEGAAIALFEEQKIDWAGSPLGTFPLDFIDAYKESAKLHFSPTASTVFLRLNTSRPLLANTAFRHTLSQAVDRDALVAYVRKGAGVATTHFVPQECWKHETATLASSSPVEKVEGSISLSYTNTELYNRLAQVLQQQWREQLGVEVVLDPQEGKSFFQTLESGNFDVALSSWYADFLDPANFLEIFKTCERGTNATRWENSDYSALLTEAESCQAADQREQLLMAAESLLLQDMPIIPLYHSSFIYIKQDQLEGVFVNPVGKLCVY